MNDKEIPGSQKPIDDTTIAETTEGSASYSGQPDDLHDLFAVHASANPDEEDPLAALRSDPNYSALIRDLEYIAKQARLLFEPAQEAPSDEVWNKIQSQLGTKLPEA
ncbi:hypothetical protein [Granulicella tundricola]|uniref:Uncharacterized protein n=1 Tax=Granulicella tundricola (strain ATCC BAA-1859 / DSM 23138 / MP5ACTX9) TaxID=1198114 RepID=E8WWK8_GRATM|nr:hypothetical protein [Granulicella tundricola]ADW69672.1 hypothetical protein AciX9_2647 [Granulicella tundricola MP5ACTX9]